MDVFKEDYLVKSNMLKSLSGTTACILEASCIKAFLEDAAKEDREVEKTKRSLLKNFTIENSFPSLKRDPTAFTVPTLNNDILDKNKQNDSFQEVYLYRNITRDIAENVFYKLLNNATQLFNANIEFKKIGFELSAVFDRAMSNKKSSLNPSPRETSIMRSEMNTDHSEYNDTELPKYSQRYSKRNLKEKKLSLKRKFNNSTIQNSVTPLKINKSYQKCKLYLFYSVIAKKSIKAKLDLTADSQLDLIAADK